jgi:hypothetical protein
VQNFETMEGELGRLRVVNVYEYTGPDTFHLHSTVTAYVADDPQMIRVVMVRFSSLSNKFSLLGLYITGEIHNVSTT